MATERVQLRIRIHGLNSGLHIDEALDGCRQCCCKESEQ